MTHGVKVDVSVNADGIELPGILTVPGDARGVVLFAHGSGSSRFSSRNQFVATTLVQRRCATLLFDLLTDAEASDRSNVFDIALLGRRVIEAAKWLRQRDDIENLPLGFFGASTGAAAALVAAAELGDDVTTVVSRGGRPDLAGDALPKVTAPTLLIVGSCDETVLELNRDAQSRMTSETRLDVIEGATNLFEEPGTLEEASQTAGTWFETKFDAPRANA